VIGELKEQSPNSKVALLLRHADREPIPQGEFGNEIPINEKGKYNAIAFGEQLKGFQVNQIFTSPIYRCIQTAEYIRQGFDSHLEITVTKSLGAPGLHIEDEQLAGEFYLRHSFEEFYRRFVCHEHIPGVVSPKAYHIGMEKFLKEHTTENGLTIFVTHDSLIAFYDFCLTGKVYTKENWVKYLTGLILNY
jgi:broad specificity phosphatase PhoE